MTDAPAWLDELRLEPGPPYQAMGTHALDPRDWLRPDGDAPEQLCCKRMLLAARRDVVRATTPAADEPSRELAAIVGATGGDDDHPLVRAALAVQDDLVVVQREGGTWIVTAGVVCFPTHWRIGDKLGQPLAAVHEPVAHYAGELRERVDRLFDRLQPEHPVWRRNWFVVPTADLHLPHPSPVETPGALPADGSPLWIRSERQTLRRLPRTGAIVFTIRVQRAPLGVLRQRPDVAERMLAAIRSWDEPKRAYTSTGRVLALLDAWLAAVQ